jgi:hypothetical protein
MGREVEVRRKKREVRKEGKQRWEEKCELKSEVGVGRKEEMEYKLL